MAMRIYLSRNYIELNRRGLIVSELGPSSCRRWCTTWRWTSKTMRPIFGGVPGGETVITGVLACKSYFGGCILSGTYGKLPMLRQMHHASRRLICSRSMKENLPLRKRHSAWSSIQKQGLCSSRKTEDRERRDNEFYTSEEKGVTMQSDTLRRMDPPIGFSLDSVAKFRLFAGISALHSLYWGWYGYGFVPMAIASGSVDPVISTWMTRLGGVCSFALLAVGWLYAMQSVVSCYLLNTPDGRKALEVQTCNIISRVNPPRLLLLDTVDKVIDNGNGKTFSLRVGGDKLHLLFHPQGAFTGVDRNGFLDILTMNSAAAPPPDSRRLHGPTLQEAKKSVERAKEWKGRRKQQRRSRTKDSSV